MNIKPMVGGMALAMALAGAAAAAPADKAAPKTVKGIQSCMSKNLVGKGALRDLSLSVFDKEGKVRDLRLRLFWKPSKSGGTRVNLRLVEPPAMAGSSYLLLQQGFSEEVYFALPGADRALRITGQHMDEPLWGTDFSYGEIKQVLGLLYAGDTQRQPDKTVAGRPVYVLETKTSASESGYLKVLSYVDQKTCVLLKSEFFAKPDAPHKVLEADAASLLQADKYWTVLGYTMTNKDKGSHTKLELSDISFDERLSEKRFDPKTFGQSDD